MGYKVDKICDDYLFDRLCNIKYIQTYCISEATGWLDTLKPENYKVIWFNQHRIILENKINNHDIVIIDSKAIVRYRLIKKYYNAFSNDDYYNQLLDKISSFD